MSELSNHVDMTISASSSPTKTANFNKVIIVGQ